MKRLFIIFFLVATSIVTLVYLAESVDAFIDKNDNELIVGFVTDIHAGSGKTKEKGSGTITPANFEKNISSALDDMQDADHIIALGDNLDSRKNCQEYADKLKKVTTGYDMKWVKGNHDKDACFSFLSSQSNYYFDERNNWRIIIFNNSYWYPKKQRISMRDKIGYVSQEEMDWLKNALDTDRKVLIAMHVPMWDDNGEGKDFTLRSDYADFKKMIEERGNVKYVMSGHYHNDNWQHEENGITYHILPSIEQEGTEGYHMVLKLE